MHEFVKNFYLLIEDYMERKSVAESLQIDVKAHWIHWFKTSQ